MATTSAAFLGQDTATQGNWQNVYGTQGYDIVGGTDTLPSVANVALAGATGYKWTTTTTDPRALQTSENSNRVAAAWYSITSFTIAVTLGDGQAHDVGLYALDWDNLGRSEQIQISSADTGAILDTETISNFSGGVYLRWKVTGSVIITVTVARKSQRGHQWTVCGLSSILGGGKPVERQRPDGRDRGKPVQRHRHRREFA